MSLFYCFPSSNFPQLLTTLTETWWHHLWKTPQHPKRKWSEKLYNCPQVWNWNWVKVVVIWLVLEARKITDFLVRQLTYSISLQSFWSRYTDFDWIPNYEPFKLAHDDRAANLATENINRSIKSVARTITKTALSDKVSSKSILEKAGLRTLNEMVASQTALMVWKSKKAKDPLGRKLFPDRSIMRHTRSINSTNATQPVPGNNTLAANLMARAWNSSTELHTVTTIGAAKSVARKWAQNLQVH